MEVLHPQSPPCQAWEPQRLRKKRYYVLNFSCDLKKLSRQGDMWLYGWFSVTISQYPARFGDNKPCRRGDVQFSIWHETSCDHEIIVVQLLYELYLTIFQRRAWFGRHMSSEGRNISFWVCYITLRDHVLRYMAMWHMWLHGWVYLTVSPQLATFDGHSTSQRGYITHLFCHVITHDHVVRGSCDFISV